MVQEATKTRVKEQNTEYGVEPLVDKKYDTWIAATIVLGALLLVGLVYLNIDAI